jgi:ribonuclease R
MDNLENVLKIIEKQKKITVDQVANQYHGSFETLSNELRKVSDDELSKYKWGMDNNLYFVDNKNYFFGTLRVVEKGFGFVINADEEIDDAFVPPVALNDAINSDKIIYTMEKEEDGRYKASVTAVIVRDKKYLVGNIEKNREYLDFVPNESNFKNYRFRILNKNEFKYGEGDIVKAKLIRVDGRFMMVRIQKIIGSDKKAADRILSIAYEFGIEPDFNGRALAEATNVAKPIDYKSKEVARRKKIIKDLNLVTIDGVDSKDLDDAIYIEKNQDGSFRLLVAIADVAHYVRPRTDLDNNALNRGNSVYLANRVIPMLPKILSDGVCSLNPNEEKLCMVCDMKFSSEGKFLHSEIYESIMISKARLNYKQVNEYYGQNKISESDATKKVLDDALELHNAIENLKDAKGVIDFDIDEPKIIMDADSNVTDIEVRERGISERLIENFMVAANEAVAKTIEKKELPFIYRDHGDPDPESIVKWISGLKMLGLNVAAPKDINNITPKDIKEILNVIDKTISERKEKIIINITLLQHMAKAKYELINIGHFGLASECYTHFTSPIRRYSDLIVHRYLKQYLIEKDLRAEKLENNKKFVMKACDIINRTEKQAVDAEREVIKICATEYMSHKVGQTFEGYIVAVRKFGMFVQIMDGIEGLVHVSTMPDFAYDEKAEIMVNKNNNFYRIAQKVKIKLTNADVKKRVIDFELV